MLQSLQNKIAGIITPSVIATTKPIALTVIPLLVIGDILVVAENSDVITFSLLFLYIACILLFKLNSKRTFLFALGSLFIMYTEYLISGPSAKAEKAGEWLFLFLGVGIIQQWRELKK